HFRASVAGAKGSRYSLAQLVWLVHAHRAWPLWSNSRRHRCPCPVATKIAYHKGSFRFSEMRSKGEVRMRTTFSWIALIVAGVALLIAAFGAVLALLTATPASSRSHGSQLLHLYLSWHGLVSSEGNNALPALSLLELGRL